MFDLTLCLRSPLARYRMISGIFGLVLIALVLGQDRNLVRQLGLEELRIFAAASLMMFCVAGNHPWVEKHAHASFYLVCLPTLHFLSLQLYNSDVADGLQFNVAGALILSALPYSNRGWLLAHLATWVSVTWIAVALVVEPKISFNFFFWVMAGAAVTLYVVVNSIITTQRRRHKDRLLLEQSQAMARIGGWEMGVSSERVFLSDAAISTLRMSVENFAESSFEDTFYSKSDYDNFMATCRSAIEEKKGFEIRLRLIDPKGGEMWIQCTARPIVEEDRVVRLVGVFFDMTERLQTERELHAARLSAEQAGMARTRFLANMSHEIRTPMNGVIGMTSILLESDLDARDRSHIEIIRASGESLLNIINEILDFSKYESGQVELENEPFGLENVVSEVVDIVSPMSDRKGINVYLETANFPVKGFVGDSSKIRQVILNLMSNAIKFTETGSVTLRIFGDASANRVSEISFSVIDSGIGIDDAALEHLFDPFTQEDASTSRRFGGSGLGLAISKQIVEAMGGKIKVTSTKDVGSEFSFTIPLLASDAEIFELPEHSRIAVVTNEDRLARLFTQQVADFGGLADRLHDLKSISLEYKRLFVSAELLDTAALQHLETEQPELKVIILARLTEKLPNHLKHLDLLPVPVRHGSLRTLLGLGFSHSTQTKQVANISVGNLSVLLAEDNRVNQLVANQMLKKLNLSADVACDGFEVIAQVKQRDYDVILMDMQMPEMDGIEATKRIRENTQWHQPYIIAMTANVLPEDKVACAEAGMDDFVAKPVRLEDLEEALLRFTDPDLRSLA